MYKIIIVSNNKIVKVKLNFTSWGHICRGCLKSYETIVFNYLSDDDLEASWIIHTQMCILQPNPMIRALKWYPHKKKMKLILSLVFLNKEEIDCSNYITGKLNPDFFQTCVHEIVNISFLLLCNRMDNI